METRLLVLATRTCTTRKLSNQLYDEHEVLCDDLLCSFDSRINECRSSHQRMLWVVQSSWHVTYSFIIMTAGHPCSAWVAICWHMCTDSWLHNHQWLIGCMRMCKKRYFTAGNLNGTMIRREGHNKLDCRIGVIFLAPAFSPERGSPQTWLSYRCGISCSL